MVLFWQQNGGRSLRFTFARNNSGFTEGDKADLTYLALRPQLLELSKSAEKMYKVDDHIACSVAGLTADANILISEARQLARRHELTYQEPMPVEQLVQVRSFFLLASICPWSLEERTQAEC